MQVKIKPRRQFVEQGRGSRMSFGSWRLFKLVLDSEAMMAHNDLKSKQENLFYSKYCFNLFFLPFGYNQVIGSGLV